MNREYINNLKKEAKEGLQFIGKMEIGEKHGIATVETSLKYSASYDSVRDFIRLCPIESQPTLDKDIEALLKDIKVASVSLGLIDFKYRSEVVGSLNSKIIEQRCNQLTTALSNSKKKIEELEYEHQMNDEAWQDDYKKMVFNRDELQSKLDKISIAIEDLGLLDTSFMYNKLKQILEVNKDE